MEEFDYYIIYKKYCLNKNAAALSRIEVNVNSVDSVTKNLFNYVHQFNQYIKATNDTQSMIVYADVHNYSDSDETAHSNLENPILAIPISEAPVNIGKHQLIISQVSHSPSKPKTIK